MKSTAIGARSAPWEIVSRSAEEIAQTMTRRTADIVSVSIELRVKGEMVLFVLLAAEGTVNRMGTGSILDEEKRLSTSGNGKALFEKLRSEITDELLENTGGYDLPDQRGQPCALGITLRFANGCVDGFGFSYGSKSRGPPAEIRWIVQRALELTDPLYQQNTTRAVGQR
jgi:hypothetical protein